MRRGEFRIFKRRMAGIDAVEASTRHVFARHTHDQFGIGVIERGAQRSLSGRGTVEAGPGDAITVNPGEVHDGAPIGEAGRWWRMLYLDPALLAEAVGDIGEGMQRDYAFPRPVFRRGDIAVRIRTLFAAVATPGEGGSLRAEEALLMLLSAVLREPLQPVAATAVPRALRRAKALIDDEPARPVLLADLARECGLSRFQVLRGFVKATGFTPHAYLLQRRIVAARRLIAGGTPLAEAAAASGFADQSHMTRMFVRTYGVSPGAYAAAIA